MLKTFKSVAKVVPDSHTNNRSVSTCLSVCREPRDNAKMSPPNQTSFDVAANMANQCDDSGAACNQTNNNEQESQQRQRKQQQDWEGPPAQGLYDPINEHEACGVGFIVAIDGKRSHKVTLFDRTELVFIPLSPSFRRLLVFCWTFGQP